MDTADAIPLITLFSAGLMTLLQRWKALARPQLRAILLLGAGLGVLTFNQSRAYADAETLYRNRGQSPFFSTVLRIVDGMLGQKVTFPDFGP